MAVYVFIKAIIEIVILLVNVIWGFREPRCWCLHNFLTMSMAF